MNKIIFIILLTLLSTQLSFADTSERMKAQGENMKGSAQEIVGDLTNDTDLKEKGKANKTKGKLRQSKENIKDMMAEQ